MCVIWFCYNFTQILELSGIKRKFNKIQNCRCCLKFYNMNYVLATSCEYKSSCEKEQRLEELTKVSVLSIYLPIKEIPKKIQSSLAKKNFVHIFLVGFFVVFIVSLINTVKIQRTHLIVVV